jgi:hypothetical protein
VQRLKVRADSLKSLDKKAGFIAIQAVSSACYLSADKFVEKHLKGGENAFSSPSSFECY